MGNPSAEALLISALLHNHDVSEAAKYQITPEKFRGYREEYIWLQNYLDTYQEQPSIQAFEHAFPDFPLRNHTDTRWAADEVLRSYFSAELTRAVSDSIDMLKTGDVAGAYARVREKEYRPTSAIPINLVSDMTFFDQQVEEDGIEVPWPTLQNETGGLREGNYIVFAARLGQGKTAYLLRMACHAILKGKKVLFYSLEMTEAEVRARVHSILAQHFGWGPQFTSRNIRDRKVDQRDYKELIQELAEKVPGELNVHTPALGPVSPGTVQSRADDYDMVFIDYATLMCTDDGNQVSDDWRSATQVSNRLKQIGLATSTTIVLAAQINREGDTNGSRPPKVKNLAQADAFGQDADLVVTFKAFSKTTTIFSIEKNRHGPSAKLYYTRFQPNEGIFNEISRGEAEERRLNDEDSEDSL